jgi:hypothetical protein
MISHHLFDKLKTKFLICQMFFQKNSDFFSQSRVRYKYHLFLEKLYEDNKFFHFVNSAESFFFFLSVISLINKESGL